MINNDSTSFHYSVLEPWGLGASMRNKHSKVKWFLCLWNHCTKVMKIYCVSFQAMGHLLPPHEGQRRWFTRFVIISFNGEEKSESFSEVRSGLFAVSNFLLPPVQRSHYAFADNKGQFASPIFVPHKPSDGFCLNMEMVSSLNLIRPLRNHSSGKAWLKFSWAATSERNQGKRGVPGNMHVRCSSAGLIKIHFNLLSSKKK